MISAETTAYRQPEAAVSDDDIFGMENFDIQAAFAGAVSGVASDEALALEEKVSRMQTIVEQGTSDTYRELIDLRALAAQMQLACAHDYNLQQSLMGNELLGGFMNEHGADDGHEHREDDQKIDKKAEKKKKKKKRGWLEYLLSD